MQGFSFREFLNRNAGTDFPDYSLEEIMNDHLSMSRKITSGVKILLYFEEYLKNGYFPYYNELPGLYHQRVAEVANMIIEVELPMLRGVEPAYIPRIKQLLLIISESAPFVPNISKLSERIGITRIGLLNYLNALQEANLTIHLSKSSFGISRLQKPDKVFLENTNLMYAVSPDKPNSRFQKYRLTDKGKKLLKQSR